MNSNPFVRYLNTLHNVDADNPSAYTEMSIASEYFRSTMVPRDIGNYIARQLQGQRPHVFVLTGHAGDGKTAILYQILKDWGAMKEEDKLADIVDVTMPNGRVCRCIKDFSELEAAKRAQIFRDILAFPESGKSAFLVANTGPLISTFSELMGQDEVNGLVGAIDDNHGEIGEYQNVPIAAVNVATIDNSSFVLPFLKNILRENLWEPCLSCEKAGHCPIATNRQLMSDSLDIISEFIAEHYVWQQEHGNKLTIRQIVAHLAYTLTGGLECESVRRVRNIRFQYLCANNFFGYKGVKPDVKAAPVKAIADVLDEGYDQTRIRADEKLFIKNDFSDLPQKVRDILETDGRQAHSSDGWQQAVRRAYIFMGCGENPDARDELKRNIFSPWFPRFLEIRRGATADENEKTLVVEALKMLFLGSISADSEIPITMRREENGAQYVQLVYDNLQKKYLKFELVPIPDFSSTARYALYLKIKSERLTAPLTLPLMNYFEEMRRGAIQTNIDPQLSQGIDSLRAQLIALVEGDDEDLEIRIATSEGWEALRASFDGSKWMIE